MNDKAQTARWLQEHPYADNTGLADQLADELDAEREMPFEPDPACGACGRITIDDLFHDCDLAPAGMSTIKARLELVPYVIVDRIGFYWASTTSRSLALDLAAKIRGRAITTSFGEIVEVDDR